MKFVVILVLILVNAFFAASEMTIYDVEEILGIHIPEGEYDTLSGYITEQLGRIPTNSDVKKEIKAGDVVYTIEKIADKHITTVKACKVKKDNINNN